MVIVDIQEKVLEVADYFNELPEALMELIDDDECVITYNTLNGFIIDIARHNDITPVDIINILKEDE